MTGSWKPGRPNSPPRRRLGAKAFTVRATAVRSLAHRVANEIIYRVTGQTAPFNTRFAYARKTSKGKEIALVEFDGHGTVSLPAVPVAAAEDPDALITSAEDPDELVATSEGDPAPAASSPAEESPSLAAARSRLDQANAAYSNMLARNYPRGDARAAIIAERDAARAAYQSAGGEATED